MLIKETFPVVILLASKDEISPKLNRKADGRQRSSGYFSSFAKALTFLFCCLFFLPVSYAQEYSDLTIINPFLAATCDETTPIQEQRIVVSESKFLRLNELGQVYNPTFPKTRNKVSVRNYQKQGARLLYIGKSVSTNRATILLKGRVGEFYSLMSDGFCLSMIEYDVERKGDYLHVSGKLYQCCCVPETL